MEKQLDVEDLFIDFLSSFMDRRGVRKYSERINK